MNKRSAVRLLLVCLIAALQGFQACGAATGPEGLRADIVSAQPGPHVLRAALEVQPKVLDVPYVPTPERVVDAMLKVAQVKKDDILYDLGCGDGRIVITAAKRMGTRGVGIDLDPERIRESRANAKHERVNSRVEFLNQDLFDTDISDATVLTLYLLPSVNLKLRPKIFHDLRPGSRVVSHDFNMGTWEPDQTIDLNGTKVYFWVVPSNASGVWEGSIETADDSKGCVLQLNQSYQKIAGTVTFGGSSLPIKRAELVGDKVQFTVEQQVNGRLVPMRFEGRVSGDSIQGNVKSERQDIRGRRWEVRRRSGTAVPLDTGCWMLDAGWG